jgi:glycerophosphoryl diester phosphodiesterase
MKRLTSFLLVMSAVACADDKPPEPGLSHTTLVIAHRGNSGTAPENTLASISEALDIGAPIVECDIQLTADGVAVLMHADTIDRTTDGSGAIAEMTLADLEGLDAGSWKDAAYAGEIVPTLEDALALADGRGRLYLDVKAEGAAEAIVNAATSAGVSAEDVFLGANTVTQLIDFHLNAEGFPIIWWGEIPTTIQPGYFEAMEELGVAGYEQRWSTFDQAFQDAAQQAGFPSWVYTINDVDEMQAAIDVGVDAIETDYPQRLIDLTEEAE